MGCSGDKNEKKDNVYIIIEGEFRNTFEERVNELLQQGYLHLGVFQLT